MNINPESYTHALYPLGLPEYLSDEDVAHALDKSARHSKAARKAQETIRQRRAEQQAAQEKASTHAK